MRGYFENRKKVFLRAIFFVSVFLPCLVYAEDLPRPVDWVNDFAGVISQEYKQKLDSLISTIEEKTSAEIAVVTISSIAPYDELEYARRLFDYWKPGKRGKDNGVLLLLAVKERRWRIETGYGMEGLLPDGLCGEIGRQYMVPYFKTGDFSQGLYQGVARIYQVLSKDVSAVAPNRLPENYKRLLIVLLLLLVIVIGIISNLVPENGYYHSDSYYGGHDSGGGFGGGSFGGFGGGSGGGGGAGGGF